jgi:hypothetical protein
MALMIACLTGCATITKSLEIQRSEFVLVTSMGRAAFRSSRAIEFHS